MPKIFLAGICKLTTPSAYDTPIGVISSDDIRLNASGMMMYTRRHSTSAGSECKDRRSELDKQVLTLRNTDNVHKKPFKN